MRHNPSTVVVLAGRPAEPVLAAVGRSLNVVVVRPQPASAAAGAQDAAGEADRGLEAAAGALRRAAGISAPYVLVTADPLGAVAEAWQAMWSITAEPSRGDEFELRAAETLASWRAKRFELPDYYLVLAEETGPGTGRSSTGQSSTGRAITGRANTGSDSGTGHSGAGDSGAGERRADFYLGPLRAVRPNRVSVAAGASPEAQADALLSELGSLRHGPWWPSLDEVFRTARGFYPGALAESTAAGQGGLLG